MNAEGLIQFEEGRRHDAYPDTRGIWTIGIGHTGPEVCEGLVWNDEQIDSQFAADFQKAHDGIREAFPWFDQLDEVRAAVVVSMAFQMGVEGVKQFMHTMAALRDQRWNDAAGGIRGSLWHKQTFLRAERAARAIETGEWQC